MDEEHEGSAHATQSHDGIPITPLEQALTIKPNLPTCKDLHEWSQDPLWGTQSCALMLIAGLADLQRLGLGQLRQIEQISPWYPAKVAVATLQFLASHALALWSILPAAGPALTRAVADRDGIAKALVLGHPYANTVDGILDVSATVALRMLQSVHAGKLVDIDKRSPDIWEEIRWLYEHIWTDKLGPDREREIRDVAFEWLRQRSSQYLGSDRGVWHVLRQHVAAEYELAWIDLHQPNKDVAPAPLTPAPSGDRERQEARDRKLVFASGGRLKPSACKFLTRLPKLKVEDVARESPAMSEVTARKLSAPLQRLGLVQRDPDDGMLRRTAEGDAAIERLRRPAT